jgi:hypothetical protein
MTDSGLDTRRTTQRDRIGGVNGNWMLTVRPDDIVGTHRCHDSIVMKRAILVCTDAVARARPPNRRTVRGCAVLDWVRSGPADRLRVYLRDNRDDPPRTSAHARARNSGLVRQRGARNRGSILLRDEEAVGSNPATPTQQIRALQHAQGSISCAETAMYSSGSTAACLFGEVSARVPCWTATSPPWAREAALARDRPRTCRGTRCHTRARRASRCARSCSMCRAGALTQTHQCASARRARSAAGQIGSLTQGNRP